MRSWQDIDAAITAAADGFDPCLLTVSDAMTLLPLVLRAKNTLAAVEAQLAGRVAESDRWRASGARSAAEDHARRTGTSVGAARDALAAAAAMRESERLRTAALAGKVSPAQAGVIGDAAETAPDAVDSLLDLVESGKGGSGGSGGSLPELKAAAERAKAAADPDPDATRRRIHARRSVWTRRDKDGSKVLSWRDNSDRIDLGHAGLADLHEQLFQQARRDGRHERPDALDADALYHHLTGQPVPTTAPASGLDLFGGAGPASPPRPGPDGPAPAGQPGGLTIAGDHPAGPLARQRANTRPSRGVFGDAKILIRLDAPAAARGRPLPGELCENAGKGPIAVSTVKDLAARGAKIALIGTDEHGHVSTVAHIPRARSATLDLSDPDQLRQLLDHYGRPVAGVVHTGRAPTAHQNTALQWISPTCAAEGCTKLRTETDHNTGWAITRDTILEDLDPLCPFHHDLKTHHSWKLDPGTGPRPFRPPDRQAS